MLQWTSDDKTETKCNEWQRKQKEKKKRQKQQQHGIALPLCNPLMSNQWQTMPSKTRKQEVLARYLGPFPFVDAHACPIVVEPRATTPFMWATTYATCWLLAFAPLSLVFTPIVSTVAILFGAVMATPFTRLSPQPTLLLRRKWAVPV